MARPLRLGLTLAVAIATVGCGTASPSSSVPGDAVAAGSVVLPAGSALDPTSLTVAGPFDASAVGSGGAFSVPVGSGPTMVFVVDSSERIVLMGFIRPGTSDSRLDASSTALVLLYLALGAFTLPAEHFGAAIDVIAATPEAAELRPTIEARLVANPTAITDGDPDMLSAILAARDRILAPILVEARATGDVASIDTDLSGPAIVATLAVSAGSNGRPAIALGADAGSNVVVTDPGERSGIEILANPDGPGIVARNSRRRDVSAFIYQVGSEDAAGRRTDFPDPVLVGDAHAVPATRRLNLFKSPLDAFSSAGQSAWAPVFSDPIDLPLRERSVRTFYAVIAVGPTADPSDVPALFTTPFWFEELDRWKAEIDRLDLFGFHLDYLIPIVSQVAFGSVYQVSTAGAKQFEAAMRQGTESVLRKYGIASPLTLRGRILAISASIKEAGLNASYADDLIRNATAAIGEQQLNAQRTALVRASFRYLSKAAMILAIVDAFLSAADMGAIAKDLLTSSQAESWSVTAVEAAVRILPGTGHVSSTSPSVAFSVEVQGNPNALYIYRWSTPGAFGQVSDFLTDGLSVVTTSARALYLVNDPPSITADLRDTVMVEVFADDGSGTIRTGASPLGKASATVTGEEAEESQAPAVGEGDGRLVVDSLEFFDTPFNKTKWCVGYWLAIPFTPGATDYFVHATGFVGADTDPVQDFHILFNQIGSYPDPITACPSGILFVGEDIWIHLATISSYGGPILKADADAMEGRFKNVVAEVRTE